MARRRSVKFSPQRDFPLNAASAYRFHRTEKINVGLPPVQKTGMAMKLRKSLGLKPGGLRAGAAAGLPATRCAGQIANRSASSNFSPARAATPARRPTRCSPNWRQGRLIALAYHVDYWDYLGWQDTLSHPENTERQHDYGRAFGIRSVYTPQAVINGRMHVNGANAGSRGHAGPLQKSGEGMSVDLKASCTATASSSIPATRRGRSDAHVVIVYFDAAADGHHRQAARTAAAA